MQAEELVQLALSPPPAANVYCLHFMPGTFLSTETSQGITQTTLMCIRASAVDRITKLLTLTAHHPLHAAAGPLLQSLESSVNQGTRGRLRGSRRKSKALLSI